MKLTPQAKIGCLPRSLRMGTWQPASHAGLASRLECNRIKVNQGKSNHFFI